MIFFLFANIKARIFLQMWILHYQFEFQSFGTQALKVYGF
jgi:hypothetical protein